MILCQESVRSFVNMVWANRNWIAPWIIALIVAFTLLLIGLTSINQHFAEITHALLTL